MQLTMRQNQLTFPVKFLGLRVIYTGLHQSPQDIVNIAIQEDVNAIGLSILSGAHNVLFEKVVELLKKNSMDDILVFGGGIIPDEDKKNLEAMGVNAIFGPGTPLDEIVDYVEKNTKLIR